MASRIILSLALAALLLAGGVLLSPARRAAAATVWSASLTDSVASLPVAVELRTGYDRALFRHWIDVDGDCQSARHEVLQNESLAPVTFTTAANCLVDTGQWFSYYDGVTAVLAADVDIDHVVALAEAWDSGAHSWTPAEREAFANDMGDDRSLIAVTASSNSSKSDSDPTNWLPAFQQCRYIADWTAVKIRWALTVDQAEKDRLASLAAGCPAATVTVEVMRSAPPPPPPPPADTTPPTAPTALTAVSSATSVTLAWTASTDAVGVAGYRVSRNSTLVATVATPGFVDTGLAAGTAYTYSVVAFDAAGNTSAAATAAATTPANRLTLTGRSRLVGTAKYADLSWSGGTATRFDLWRGTTRLLRNTTVRTHTNQVTATTRSAVYTVCPTGVARTSTQCSSVTVNW